MRALLARALLLTLAGCGANAPTYAGCTDEADCGEDADACYRLLFDRSDGSRAEGNLCSRGCETDADCPLAGVCLALEGDPSATRFCAAPCARSADCYADFVCTPVTGMDLALCLP